MTTGGAGELSTAALERCLDWALSSGRGWRDPGELGAARAGGAGEPETGG